MYTTKAQICIRRDTAANFTSANPTLALGEIAYETDSRNIKVGDGTTAWTSLKYINPYRGDTGAASGTSNIALGNLAGNGLGASSANNVALGNLALSSNTAGTGNTIVGRGAGAGNASFTGCTAVGLSALNLNTASDITAVGANALDANTTGTNNTAVGKDALGANTTGSSSVAIGNGALSAQTTTGSNTAVGYLAGQLCTADSSTFVGNQAGNGITSGSANTCIGHVAGSAALGSFNTFVGSFAGDSAAASTGNTAAVGYAACFSQGSSNAALGSTAGYLRADGTVGTGCTNSVFIGYDSRPAGDSQSNQIVIGEASRGNGSNTTTIGNSSTTQVWLAGRVVPGRHPSFGGSGFGTSGFYLHTTGSDNGGIRGNFIGMDCTGSFAVRSNDGVTNRLVVEDNGNVTVSNGNLILGTSGKGIDFSATTEGTGTMTSELLSDYEEGTWTPVYAPATGSFTTLTMDVTGAKYVKIGSQVTVTAMIRTDNVNATGASGGLRISGLPFSTSSVGRGSGGASIALSWGGDYPQGVLVSESRTYLDLYYRDAVDGTDLLLDVSDMTTGATANQNTVYITCTYFA